MSRSQSGLPLKSNALKIPVPVITKTLLPSVAGEGEDMFCLLILKLPPPSNFLQITAPLVLSTIQRYRSFLLASATLRKTTSPQIIGVAPLRSGIASFQAILSSGDQRTGRLVSGLIPFSPGPRHCGQFSARSAGTESTARENARQVRFISYTRPQITQNPTSDIRNPSSYRPRPETAGAALAAATSSR